MNPSPASPPALFSHGEGMVRTMSIKVGRSAKAQLSTAHGLLAQFDEQIAEYERMTPLQRKTTPRGRDLTSRIDGLREGRAKWVERAAALTVLAAEEQQEAKR